MDKCVYFSKCRLKELLKDQNLCNDSMPLLPHFGDQLAAGDAEYCPAYRMYESDKKKKLIESGPKPYSP